jgi:hypothetical protein
VERFTSVLAGSGREASAGITPAFQLEFLFDEAKADIKRLSRAEATVAPVRLTSFEVESKPVDRAVLGLLVYSGETAGGGPDYRVEQSLGPVPQRDREARP